MVAMMIVLMFRKKKGEETMTMSADAANVTSPGPQPDLP